MKKHYRIAAGALTLGAFGMLTGTALAKDSGGSGSEVRPKAAGSCVDSGGAATATEIEGEIRVHTGRPSRWKSEVEGATPGSVWNFSVSLTPTAVINAAATADVDGEAEVEGRVAGALTAMTATATSDAGEVCMVSVSVP